MKIILLMMSITILNIIHLNNSLSLDDSNFIINETIPKKIFSENEFINMTISIKNNLNSTTNAIINITTSSNEISKNEIIHVENRNFKPFEKYNINISKPFPMGQWDVNTEIQHNDILLAKDTFHLIINSVQEINEEIQALSAKKTADLTSQIVFISMITAISSILFAVFTLRQQKKGIDSTLKEMKIQTENTSKSIQITSDSLRLSQKQMILQYRPLVFRNPEDRLYDEVDLKESNQLYIPTPRVEYEEVDNNRSLTHHFNITNYGKLPALNLRKKFTIIEKKIEHSTMQIENLIEENLKDLEYERINSLIPKESKKILFEYSYPLKRSFAIFQFDYDYLQEIGRYNLILEFDRHWNIFYESMK